MFKYFPPSLGVSEIKALYKTLAKINHPDKPGGDAKRMQEINAEYKTALILAEARKKAYKRKPQSKRARPVGGDLEKLLSLTKQLHELLRKWK